MIGGGLALLMLSTYFGLDFGMYSNAIAFGVMIIITVAGGLLADVMKSRILAGTTIFAGFLTPILVSTGHANEMVLFNYLLLLTGAMFVLVYRNG
jgi:uncharacterized membrane protein